MTDRDQGGHAFIPRSYEIREDLHSFLVAMNSSINKKPCITNHRNFIYPCKVHSCEVTNYKLNPAFKWEKIYEHSP